MHEVDNENDLFPVTRASEISGESVSQSWLIEDLWTSSAVGWIAGTPKSYKSWTALEMAVSIASGTPYLGRFRVHRRGKALVYLAEDALPAVRERLEALASEHGVSLDDLDLDVITASSMRLDLLRDQVRLQKTVRALAPRLLVLDPLVRIHRADENSSAEISSLLAYLRELQRELDVAIVVVHHVRKSGASVAGQGLRGSGDLHAWSDSALYLRRKGEEVVVTVEHRAAPTPAPFGVRLETDQEKPRLRFVEASTATASATGSIERGILDALAASPGGLTRTTLRGLLSVQNQRLGAALEQLAERGDIARTSHGWQLAAPDRSVLSIGMNGNGTPDGDGMPSDKE